MAEIFGSWDNTGINGTRNHSRKPTSGFPLTPMQEYGGEGGIRTPVGGSGTQNGLAKRVIALWLAGKSLKTKDTVRLALDGLGTVGRLLG